MQHSQHSHRDIIRSALRPECGAILENEVMLEMNCHRHDVNLELHSVAVLSTRDYHFLAMLYTVVLFRSSTFEVGEMVPKVVVSPLLLASAGIRDRQPKPKSRLYCVDRRHRARMAGCYRSATDARSWVMRGCRMGGDRRVGDLAAIARAQWNGR